MNRIDLKKRPFGFLLRTVITIVLLGMFICGPFANVTQHNITVSADEGTQVDNIIGILCESLQGVNQQMENLTPAQKKIDSNILQALGKITGIGNEANTVGALETTENTVKTAGLSPLIKTDSEGNIQVDLTLSDIDSEQINELKNLGMNITITLPEYGIVEGWLPDNQVEAVASLGFVTHIGTPDFPIYHTGAVNSQGDSVLKANLARTDFGVDGSGVKIGVMSNGVTNLLNSVASGDLPSSVNVLKAGSGYEGTAMLEIIYDLAPGAQLAFYSPESSLDMVVGIRALETAGCRIIVDDITFSGEPKFEDGPIAQETRAFVNRGGIYVTSCGNEALTHYYHIYERDSYGDNRFHHYSESGLLYGANTFTVVDGETYTVILQWNNKWGNSGDNFDIALVDYSTQTALAGSTSVQDGNDNPYEAFQYTHHGSSKTVYLGIIEITNNPVPSSLILDYHVWNSNDLHYHTAENSIIGHATVEEVLSTAAVRSATPGIIESYSSQGPGTIAFPTAQTRQVPNITAVDGVSTHTSQYNPFYGTSAAAPHVAAIAALVWDAVPTLSSSEVRNYLKNNCIDLGSAGFDYVYGYGRVDAYEAVEATPLSVTINQAAGQADPTNSSTVNFTVVFNKSVTDFVTGDVTLDGTANATTAVITGSGTTYNVAVSGMTSDGTIIASIAYGKAHDAAGNSNTASTSTDNTVTYDTTGPTVTINQALTQVDPTKSLPINFIVEFSEPVTDFATGDVTVGGTAGGTKTATITGSGTTYNIAVSGITSDGTVIASIASGKAHDAAGNSSNASTSTDNTVTYDTTGPTVTVNQASTQVDPTKSSPINFTVIFSEPVSDFATDDVTVGGTAGGTKTATITGSETTYNVVVSGMNSDGTVTASIVSGKAHDAAGNSNTASTSTDNTVTYDTTSPTVTVNQASTQVDPTKSSPINFTVIFNEPVTDFTTDDVTVGGTAGGTKTATITGYGTTYNVAISGMTSDGTVTAGIASGKAHDAAGNSNTASTSTDNTVTYDTTGPTVTVNQASTQVDPTKSAPINFTVIFNEPVTDFTTDDVTVSGTAGGTKTVAITGSGTTYNVAIGGMTSDGTVIASIALGKAHDAAGNSNTASTSTDNTVTYDTTGPTVTVNQASTQVDPTKSAPINFTVIFNEPVTDFTTDDVTVSGTAGGTKTVAITGSGTTYNVAIGGMTSDGTVIASIALGKAHDAAGNSNTASTSTDNTVTYDTTGPTVTINQASTQVDPTKSSPISFTVIFNEPVSDFTTDDVTVGGTAGGTKTATITGSGTTYSVVVSGMISDGTITASIAAGKAHDAAGNSNTASTSTDNTVTYDTTEPTVTINQASEQADPTNTSPINFTVVFSEPVSDFITGDVTVGGTASGTITAAVTGSGTTYNVAISGMTSDGTIIAGIASGKAHDAAGNSNTASTSVDNTIVYDHTPPVLTSAQTKTTTTIAVTFDEDINGSTVDKTNFTIDENNVIAANRTSSCVVTLTLGMVIATGATPNLNYTKGILADLTGNLVETSSVTVDDCISPILTYVNIASNNANQSLAKEGDTITLTVTASESLQKPTAIIAKHPATVSGSGSVWTASYTLTSEDTEWLITFSINFSDQAGNVGTPVIYTTDSSFVTTIENGVSIRGSTYEANGIILPGVTIELVLQGEVKETVVSNAQGLYSVIVPQIDTYTLTVKKTDFRDQTQSIDIDNMEQEYKFNFKAKYGLIPNAPNIWYVLDCAALWKYPQTYPELSLDIWKLLDVAAAWKYPI